MLGYGRGGQAADRKNYAGKISTASDGIYVNPKDKSDAAWGARRYTRGLAVAFFTKYAQAGDVSPIIIKTGLATGDCVLQATMSHKNILDIPDILICRNKRILVVVGDASTQCWSCGAAGHVMPRQEHGATASNNNSDSNGSSGRREVLQGSR